MEVDYAAIIQVILYLFILVTGIQQLYAAYKSRNKYVSIRNGIVLLLTIAAFIRVVFWTKTCLPGSIDDTFMMLIFFLPIWFNFCGLSLLAVFYAEAVYGGRSKWPMRMCIAGNSVLLVLNVIIASGMASGNDDDEPSEAQDAFAASAIVYSSTLDFVLAVLLFYYGYRFQHLCNEHGNALTTWTPNSVSIFESINWMLIVVYILRGIAAAVISQHPEVLGDVAYNGDHAPTKGSVCIFFFITEILPSFCVILMLWRITGNTRKGVPATEESDLKTRLLSVEDSKIRVLTGQESLEPGGEDAVHMTNNLFGDSYDDSRYLLFAPSPIKGAQDTRSEGAGANEALLGPDGENGKAGPEIDVSKYSVSAESSFLDDNDGMFQPPKAEVSHADALGSRSSPVMIASNSSAGANGNLLGAAALADANQASAASTDSAPRVSFGRRGSWSRRENNYISKRTPSPNLGAERLSDADQDNPMLIGSVPTGASTGSYQSAGTLATASRHGSYNNLVGAGVSEPIKEADGEGGGEGGEKGANEMYADTISPRDILLQQQQQKKKMLTGRR